MVRLSILCLALLSGTAIASTGSKTVGTAASSSCTSSAKTSRSHGAGSSGTAASSSLKTSSRGSSSRAPSFQASPSQASSSRPSSRVSSSRPVSSPTPSGSVRPSNGDCPAVTLTTKTLTLITLSYTSTTTPITDTATRWTWTSEVTVSTNPTNYHTEERGGSTETSFGWTTTKYYFDISPAQLTVTVPTPTGFTPVRCQAEYFNPTTTVTSTSYAVSQADQPTSVITESTVFTYNVGTFRDVTSTVYFPNRTDTTYITSTLTSTITRDEATSTVYEACLATNNVTPDYPGGKFPLIGLAYESNTTTPSKVLAVDAIDCCSLCHADPLCAGSAYGRSEYFNNASYRICTLFRQNATDGVCDPQFVGPEIEYSWYEAIEYVSNGACGKYGVRWDGFSLF